MELYGTLRLGEKFRNFMELFNVFYGTEQLCFTLSVLTTGHFCITGMCTVWTFIGSINHFTIFIT